MTLFDALYAFFQERRRCGELATGFDDDVPTTQTVTTDQIRRWTQMATRVAALIALFILSGCSIPKYAWHKPDGNSTMLATDEKACWQEQPPWFVTPGSAMGDPIRRTGFKDCMEARGWTKEEPR